MLREIKLAALVARFATEFILFGLVFLRFSIHTGNDDAWIQSRGKTMIARKRLLISVMMLSLLTACAFNAGGPKYPQTPIPVSPEAVQSLQQAVTDATAQGALSGKFLLTITETQLTSYLALNLAGPAEPAAPGETAEQPNPQEQIASVVSNPQVYLQNGQIQIYGTLQYGFVSATGRVILSVTPDTQGNLTIELTEMDFGSLPLPDALKSTVSSALTDSINGAFGPINTRFRVESIAIADGAMILTGRTR